MNEGEVASRFRVALETLLAQDRHLFEVDAGEQTAAGALAVHVRELFPDYDVDVEFNRDRDQSKRLAQFVAALRAAGLGHRVTGDEPKLIRPDLIVHRRGTDENLLAVELKRVANEEGRLYDRLKLDNMRAELGYRCTAYVEFGRRPQGLDDVQVDWHGGQEAFT